LAFNKERKVKLSASNGSDVVIKSGVIEKELVALQRGRTLLLAEWQSLF
jgi:hypothetical protein